MFRNREHLVWYHSDEECLQLIDYYLERPLLRKRIAACGQRWVRRRYSMKRQVNRILRIIDEQHAR
jgi:spore maturation protein CgeB